MHLIKCWKCCFVIQFAGNHIAQIDWTDLVYLLWLLFLNCFGGIKRTKWASPQRRLFLRNVKQNTDRQRVPSSWRLC